MSFQKKISLNFIDMKKIAVFPGSFDPFTKGHESIVLRSMDLFDEIWVAIGNNPGKHCMFSLEQRMQWCKEIFKDYPKVKVASYTDLTINFCHRVGAQYIIRGLRGGNDFEYESMIYHAGKYISPDKPVETIFLITENKYEGISSSIVREIYKNGGDYSELVPEAVKLYSDECI